MRFFKRTLALGHKKTAPPPTGLFSNSLLLVFHLRVVALRHFNQQTVLLAVLGAVLSVAGDFDDARVQQGQHQPVHRRVEHHECPVFTGQLTHVDGQSQIFHAFIFTPDIGVAGLTEPSSEMIGDLVFLGHFALVVNSFELQSLFHDDSPL